MPHHFWTDALVYDQRSTCLLVLYLCGRVVYCLVCTPIKKIVFRKASGKQQNYYFDLFFGYQLTPWLGRPVLSKYCYLYVLFHWGQIDAVLSTYSMAGKARTVQILLPLCLISLRSNWCWKLKKTLGYVQSVPMGWNCIRNFMGRQVTIAQYCMQQYRPVIYCFSDKVRECLHKWTEIFFLIICLCPTLQSYSGNSITV